MPHRAHRSEAVLELVSRVEELDRMVLVELAQRGRGLEMPPAFRGRCLDAAYLDAVATGAWTLDDEALLARSEDRLDGAALSRVRRLDRRDLRAALRGALVALLTADLTVPGWAERRAGYAAVYEAVVGPLPVGREVVPV